MPCLATCGLMSLAHPDSTATPTILTPRFANFSCSLLNIGISATQGSHHVAQRSRTTMLPFNCEDLKSFPSRPRNLNSGAGLPALTTCPRLVLATLNGRNTISSSLNAKVVGDMSMASIQILQNGIRVRKRHFWAALYVIHQQDATKLA